MEVTDNFYAAMLGIDKKRPFIDGRVDGLIATHRAWVSVSRTYDASYTLAVYLVADVRVKVKLPVEFMAGAMTLIGKRLLQVVAQVAGLRTRSRALHEDQ